MGERGGTHLYGYVHNQPVSFRDSLGLTVDETLNDHGGVGDSEFDKIYRGLKSWKGEDPRKSSGATYAFFSAKWECSKCQDKVNCRQFSIVKDTWLEAEIVWRKNAGPSRKGGRTPEMHEKAHLENARSAADGFDRVLHASVKGCVTWTCCNKTQTYVSNARTYYWAFQENDNARIEYEDYPETLLDNALEQYQEASEALGIAQAAMDKAEREMNEACANR